MGVAIVTEDSGSDTSGCADELWHFLCACAVVFPWKSRAEIVMSLDDVTVITNAIWGGKYIRRASSSLKAVVWVSGTEWLGLLLSH